MSRKIVVNGETRPSKYHHGSKHAIRELMLSRCTPEAAALLRKIWARDTAQFAPSAARATESRREA